MHKNQSVNVHQFAMIPRSDVPRSSFRMQQAKKTSFDAGRLVPIFCEEVLPGDTFNLKMTAFCRLATPIFPVMDNLHLETFFFYVPNRLVWSKWVRFMGERTPNTDSTIDFTVPVVEMPDNGWSVGSIADYFGLPTVGQITSGLAIDHQSLPLRMYSLIYNEWFRDQNNIDLVDNAVGDGPDTGSIVNLWNGAPLRRGKRHDYFTGCLPWPQKGDAVTLPLGTTAPVVPTNVGFTPTWLTGSPTPQERVMYADSAATPNVTWNVATTVAGTGPVRWGDPGLQVDLSAATAATINQLRQSFQVQRLLERDARGGTRYTEILQAHFGVKSPDARLQRPEYLGGGHTMININPIAQTSGTSVTGSDTPQGNLSAYGTALANHHGFTQSFVEHGYVIGLVNVRADLTYQQGLRRHWSRSSRYDFYFPVFAQLGEQAVLKKEIYATGNPTTDDAVFGYQERWAEYRYLPSEITSLMRSTVATPIDQWHYSQQFATVPALNEDFINDYSDQVVERTTAVGDEANGQQLLGDFFFDVKAARPLPMYSVPGLIDHF